jgi:uncharacterized membrane protein
MRSRPAILYGFGILLIGVGLYQFWSDGTINQQAFLIGSVCVATTAFIQIVRDLWRRMGRQ